MGGMRAYAAQPRVGAQCPAVPVVPLCLCFSLPLHIALLYIYEGGETPNHPIALFLGLHPRQT